MSIMDRFVNELRRSGDSHLVLLSDAAPRSRGAGDERALEGRVSHKEITSLVEEIVPPDCFADLVMMEPVEFEYDHVAGQIRVRVVPGPSIWRVTLDVKGERLEPLSEEDEAAAKEAAAAEPSSRDDPDVKKSAKAAKLEKRSTGSWSEIEELVSPEGAGVQEQANPGPSKDEGESAGTDAQNGGDEAAGQDRTVASVSTDDLAALVPESTKFLDQADERDQRVRADGADQESEPEEGDIEVEVAEAEPISAEFSTQATLHISAEELASHPSPTVRIGAETTRMVRRGRDRDDMNRDVEDHGSGNASEGMGRATRRSLPPVKPLEVDFLDEDIPSSPIEELDELLDRAWKAGATAVLLRDRRPPAMGLAGRVLPLPNARREQGRLVHEILDAVVNPHQAGHLDSEGFCRFVYRPGGSGTLVRCTMVKDGGTLAAWVRRVGDEHYLANVSEWLPVSVRNMMPQSGLVLVAGSAGQGKTTTATALTATCHHAMSQTLLVAEPLERRLPVQDIGILHRQIPTDVPDAARAIEDALRLEAGLVLVDVARPETVAVDLLALAGQGRLVITTWTAPNCVAAVEALMDALPPELPSGERARRARSLRSVVAVRLVPAKAGGVTPIFETLQINQVVLSAVTEARFGRQAGAGEQDLVSLSFEASIASLQSRGLI